MCQVWLYLGFCNKSDNEGTRVAQAEGKRETGLNEFSGAKFRDRGELWRNKSSWSVQQVGKMQQNRGKNLGNTAAEQIARLAKLSIRRAKINLQPN